MSRRSRCVGCLCAVMMLGGCGAHSRHGLVRTGATTPTRTTIAPLGAASTQSPLLVYFKRVTGIDPLASELTVHRDGSSVALVTFGGISGQRRRGFTLRHSQYRRLRGLIEAARRAGLHSTDCCVDVNHYIYTLTLAGRAVRWQQRNVPRADRQLVAFLNQLLDHNTVY